MPAPANPSNTYKNLTASALVNTGPCQLAGIFVASASATPTIKVWDSLTAVAPVLVNTFTPVAATWYPMPFACSTGLFVTISGTVDCTVAYV